MNPQNKKCRMQSGGCFQDMPKKTVRIREVGHQTTGGFGQIGKVTKRFRIIDVSEDEVPEGATIVPADTPLTDGWQQEIDN